MDFFSLLPRSDRLWGQPSLLSSGYWGSFPVGKATGGMHLTTNTSSAEVKNAWMYISTPACVLMTWYLVKHRDNFTFLPYMVL